MMIEQLPIIDTAEIERLLDATRERYGLTSDEKLAHLLGVSDQAIYRWRRGQIDKSARILATLARDQAALVLS
jgi:transcriptional regulator with XRE-family HTH domain